MTTEESTAQLVDRHSHERSSLNSSNHSYTHYEELLKHCLRQDIVIGGLTYDLAMAKSDATSVRQANANYRRENEIAVADSQKAAVLLKEAYDKQIAFAAALGWRVEGSTSGSSLDELAVSIVKTLKESSGDCLRLSQQLSEIGKAKEKAETSLFNLEHPPATHKHAEGGLYAVIDEQAIFHQGPTAAADAHWMAAVVYKTMDGKFCCRLAEDFDSRFKPLDADYALHAPRVNCPEQSSEKAGTMSALAS